jgi:hypothetical protein
MYYNQAEDDILCIMAEISTITILNYDGRVKEVGDKVIVWDGSHNRDKNTGEQRCGIDPLFENNQAIVIETGCTEVDLWMDKEYVMDLLLRFPEGQEVYTSSKYVRRIDNYSK